MYTICSMLYIVQGLLFVYFFGYLKHELKNKVNQLNNINILTIFASVIISQSWTMILQKLHIPFCYNMFFFPFFQDVQLQAYQLYHLLNHANLFGGSYVSQCRASLRNLARQLWRSAQVLLTECLNPLNQGVALVAGGQVFPAPLAHHDHAEQFKQTRNDRQ